jgi:sulfur carrier protein ThiS
MLITIKLYGSYQIGRFDCAVREYPEGCPVGTIVDELQISREYLIRLKNGVHVPPDEPLQEGDTLSLLPMLDGG